MLPKATTIDEITEILPTIDWNTISLKEVRELPTIQLGSIQDISSPTEKDLELLKVWKHLFENVLPPLKKFKWGDLLQDRKDKKFSGFQGLSNQSHVYNKFIKYGYPCADFDDVTKHAGMGIENDTGLLKIGDYVDSTLNDHDSGIICSMFYHSTKAHWLTQSIQEEGLWAPIQGFTVSHPNENYSFQIHPGSIRSGCFEEMEDPSHELLIWDCHNILDDYETQTLDSIIEYWKTKLKDAQRDLHMGLLYTNGILEFQVNFSGLEFRDKVYDFGKKVHTLSKEKPLNIYVGYDSTHNGLEDVCIKSIESSIESGLGSGFLMEDTKFTPEIKLLDISKLPEYNREYANQSTEFTYSRFLIPYLENYEGFSIFVDDDFIFQKNLLPMFYYLNPDDAVACIQYPHYEHDATKFDGEVNIDYPKKLWSSMMIFNNGHEDCRKLTPEVVNTWTGKQLHQFEWTEKISKIPEKYIFVEGYDNPEEKWRYNGVHYTRGGPWIDGMDTSDINNLEVYNKYKNLLKN